MVPQKLKSTFLMQQETQWLIQALEKAHYKKVSIDELNSTKCLNSYLRNLISKNCFSHNNEVNELLHSIFTHFENLI